MKGKNMRKEEMELSKLLERTYSKTEIEKILRFYDH
jgi:hypothetical protein